MALGNHLARRGRSVSVDVGVTAPGRRSEVPPPLCIVGIATKDEPYLGDLFPGGLIRDTRFRDEDGFVEHVRFSGRDGIDMMPGLHPDHPSRLSDAVRLAIGAGAPYVDIVLARLKGLNPWDLDDPEFVFAIDPFVSNMVGTTMIYPDIGGPVTLGPSGPRDLDARVDRFIRTVKTHATRWTERYQLALLDDPGVGGDLGRRVLHGAANTDSCLVRWVGEANPLQTHGWRSAAALVGGRMASPPGDILAGVAGIHVRIDGGRKHDPGRFQQLSLDEAKRALLPEDDFYVDVEPVMDGVAFIHTEPSMRAPVGGWSIPAVRVAKVIHWRVMQAASRFVFEMADVARAVALSGAIGKALEPYADAGLLVGPDGDSAPIIDSVVVRDPAAPGLRAEITAQLKPWAHRVNVRVNLRPGAAPTLEEV